MCMPVHSGSCDVSLVVLVCTADILDLPSEASDCISYLYHSLCFSSWNSLQTVFLGVI